MFTYVFVCIQQRKQLLKQSSQYIFSKDTTCIITWASEIFTVENVLQDVFNNYDKKVGREAPS